MLAKAIVEPRVTFDPVTVTITLETKEEAEQFIALIGSSGVSGLPAIKQAMYTLFDQLLKIVPSSMQRNPDYWDEVRKRSR